jgi:hypothetical protein
MNYLGDFAVGQTVYVWFNTFDSSDPSISVTITDFINTDVHIHKDDGLTQRNNAAGITVDVDVDAITGSHFIKIDTADNTVADFFEAGHDFAVRIEGTTIDTGTVNAVVGTFSIANRRQAGEMCRSAIATLASQTSFTLDTGTASAQDDAYNNCTIIVTDQTTRIQKAVGRISDYTGTSRTVTLAAAPLASGFTMAVADSVEIFANSVFANVDAWQGTLTTSGTGGPDVNVNAISDSTTAATNAEIVNDPDFGTNYNTTDNGWVTNGTSFIGTGWNVGKTGYALTTADWNVGKTGYSVSATGLDAVLEDSTFLTALEAQVWDAALTGGSHNDATSAGRRLRQLNDSGLYEGGAVWYDDVNGAAGTTDFENGTVNNPSNAEASVTTLLASLGFTSIHCAPGSTYVLEATYANKVFIGENWTLDLNGQSCIGCVFIGATVSGAMAGLGTTQQFVDCIMGATSLIKGTHIRGSGLSGTLTVIEAGEFFVDNCHSAVAGAGSVTFDFGAALAASNLNIRHHSGGWTIANMGAGAGTYNASFEGNGQIVWAASCSATSNASIRGNWKITDNASGAVTETLDDNQTKVDTLDADWANGGRLDLILDARMAEASIATTAGVVDNVNTVDGNVVGSVGSNVELGPAEVNAEVVDVLFTDTDAEPAKGLPGATISLADKIGFLYKAWRNRSTQTATTYSLYNDDATTVDHDATVSDNATTADRGEMTDGP